MTRSKSRRSELTVTDLVNVGFINIQALAAEREYSAPAIAFWPRPLNFAGDECSQDTEPI
jgi:hypothetical protein